MIRKVGTNQIATNTSRMMEFAKMLYKSANGITALFKSALINSVQLIL